MPAPISAQTFEDRSAGIILRARTICASLHAAFLLRGTVAVDDCALSLLSGIMYYVDCARRNSLYLDLALDAGMIG